MTEHVRRTRGLDVECWRYDKYFWLYRYIVIPYLNIYAYAHTKNTDANVKRDASEKMPCLILHPESTFRVVWDCFVLLFLIYFVFAIPFRTCFIDTQYDKTNAQCKTFKQTTKLNIIDQSEYCYPIKGCTVRNSPKCPAFPTLARIQI
jgi:hypothetical protein